MNGQTPSKAVASHTHSKRFASLNALPAFAKRLECVWPATAFQEKFIGKLSPPSADYLLLTSAATFLRRLFTPLH